MDCVVCGTYPRSKIVETGGDCPVCAGRQTADVIQSYQRCCICFIPLWKCGSSSLYGRCERCGSMMPAAAARARLAEAYPMQPARVVTGTVSGQGQGGMMGAQAQGQGQGGYYSDVPAPAVMDAHATPQK